MEWGIINKDNFTTLKDIPVKRWDPLSTVKIIEKGFGLRQTIRHSGHFSYLSPIRGQRPRGFKTTEKQKLILVIVQKSLLLRSMTCLPQLPKENHYTTTRAN